MRIAFGLAVLVALTAAVVFGVSWLWRKRSAVSNGEGVDIIPYLLLSLSTGVTGFSLAGLARAALVPGRFAGRPTEQIAGALAGLVVAAPIAYLLWRRQRSRRERHPETPGWPLHLALVELVFLITFVVAANGVAETLRSGGEGAQWTNLVVYGAIVVFHWRAARRDEPLGDAAELPRLIGAGVGAVTLAVGAVGTLTWLFEEIYDRSFDIGISDPINSLVLLGVGALIWALRWLPAWERPATTFRSLYLGGVAAVTLTSAIGAAVAIVSLILTFPVGPTRGGEHFRDIPTALSLLIVGWTLWYHHRGRMGAERTGAVRGYAYSMAAVGLGSLVGSTAGLVENVLSRGSTIAGAARAIVSLAVLVVAAGWTWWHFWRSAGTDPEERTSPQRKVYLTGMSIITGLTGGGALISTLVIVFRALLGGEARLGDLVFPVALTLSAGAATWHLVTRARADRELAGPEAAPFSVTVICSHPGNLALVLPKEARLRVVYRADQAAVIDPAMAEAIVTAVGTMSSIVWVEEGSFRVAPARSG